MVQQAYSLRGTRHARGGSALTTEDLRHPALSAVVAAGLKPGILTLQAEKKRYGGNRSEYLEVRDFVLLQWEKDTTIFLTEESVTKAAPSDKRRMVREVYRFLMQQGCINLGFLRDDPLVPLPEGFLPEEMPLEEEEKNADAENEDAPPAGPPEATDEAVEDKLYEILPSIDIAVVTEKQIRAQLAEFFQVDMKSRKGFIREIVTAYLAHNGPPPEYTERKAKQAAAEAAEKQPKVSHRRPLGKVVVIGGGPAGLSAALHLKRNNVDVTVLEARSRVGGRVNSYNAPGFGAPVDLGASIITGIEADPRRGQRADPSALMCKQLGIKLHQLQSDVLPLHDGVQGGLVDEFLDKQVERLRDEMLDDVADLLDEMTTEEQENSSFGGLLEKSFALRKEKGFDQPFTVGEDDADAEKKKKEEEDATMAAVATEEKPSVAAAPVDGVDDMVTDAVAAAIIQGEDVKSKEEIKTEDQQQPSNIELPPATAETVKEEDAGPAAAKKSDDDEEANKIPLPATLSDVHLRFLHWHWANLEYGCSAPLSALSAKHWNQDEDYGGFGGPHCMVVGGFDHAFRKIASLVDVRMETPVTAVKMRDGVDSVEVVTASGDSFWCDAVVVTVPLGVLKAGGITFEPPLPSWKNDSIEKLGFGDLNKVILQFPEVFWDDSVDFFGSAKGEKPSDRGFCFMWWNFHRFAGAPILATLVSGESAHAAETATDEDLKNGAMEILQALHPDIAIPQPVACTVSRWKSEEFSRGSYSYVSIGASGDDYDRLAIPVGRRILFAGEHTIKEHPDTVGGAMISGLREAARALEILTDDKKEGAQGAEVVGQAYAELKRKHGLDAGAEPKSKKPRKSKKKSENGDEEGEEDEMDYEDEDDLDHRFDGFLGRDIERMDEEMRARQAQRAATKEVWRCLMSAEMGDILPILEIISTSKDIHSRHTVSHCLASASVKALEAVTADSRVLQELAKWVAEMVAESSQVALLDQTLKALRVMPIDAALARSSGLEKAVRRCTTFSDPDVRKIAIQVVKMYGNGDVNDKDAAKKANGNNGAAAAPATAAAAVPEKKKFELDEEAKRKIEEAEAEMKRMEEKAAALAREAAEAEEKAKALEALQKKTSLVSFEKFSKKEKNRSKSAAAVATAGGSGDAEGFDFRKKVELLVGHYLKAAYDERRISKEERDKILKKATEKVMGNVSQEEVETDGRAAYEKQKPAIKKLTVEYVNGYAQARKK